MGVIFLKSIWIKPPRRVYSSYRKVEMKGGGLIIVLSLLFLLSIGVGAYVVGSLPEDDLQSIYAMFQDYATLSAEHDISVTRLFFSMVLSSFKYLVLLFLLGLTILAPLGVPLMLLYKGAVIGFLSSCILQSVKEHTFFVLFFNVLLHNMVVMPVLLLLSGSAIGFSVQLLRNAREHSTSHSQFESQLAKYVAKFLAAAVVILILCLFAAVILSLCFRIFMK